MVICFCSVWTSVLHGLQTLSVQKFHFNLKSLSMQPPKKIVRTPVLHEYYTLIHKVYIYINMHLASYV